ncbi:MAG: hypothetical protein KGS45_02980 [Planctomycetes bacterium]|nr:hypothetical protein [Planctomycetota bacterium]
MALSAVVFLFALATPRAFGQCDGRWLNIPGQVPPGVNGTVFALAFLPNGDLVAGGAFNTAGGIITNGLARWNGAAWSSFGSGTSGSVLALAVGSNGEIFVGGDFTGFGGRTANRIARGGGTAWNPLGTGMNNVVRALVVLPNGDLVAGGDFTTAGGVAASRIARWNGSTWAPLGAGMNNVVRALAVLSNGDLIAVGDFTTAGDVAANSIARWDGSSWTPLDSGLQWPGNVPNVYAICVLPNGDLVAGGDFTTAGGVMANSIARWNGSSWSALGLGLVGTSSWRVRSLAPLPNGELVAGGSFTSAGGVAANRIARWNGSSWAPMGTGLNGTAFALAAMPGGDVIAGGVLPSTGDMGLVRGVARWNGSAWAALGAGVSEAVQDFAVMPTGEVIAGGDFQTAGGVPGTQGIARWNGLSWAALGTGTNGQVHALAQLPNGDLVAAGPFTTAGGVSANRIARWNGVSWAPLGSGMNGPVYALAVMPNGDIVAGGFFTTAGGVTVNNIARWNGLSWAPLGTGMAGAPPGFNTQVEALAVLPNGDLVAGGYFTSAGGVTANYIARWDGATWNPLGSGMTYQPGRVPAVLAMCVLSNGDLIAGGQFPAAGGVPGTPYIARWNGLSWASVGSGTDGQVSALDVLPNNDLVVGGQFTRAGGVTVNRIARWDGSSWAALGSGTNGIVNVCKVLPNGDLFAGGYFTSASSIQTFYWANWTETGIPWVARQPVGQTVSTSQTATLSATCASGYDFNGPVTFQWQRNGVPIADGPGGASPGGGAVFGATGLLASPTTDPTCSLMISGIQPSDAGSYTATFSNTCGSITSLPATITITPPPCPADFNADTVIDFFDYLDFVSAFAANQPAADFNADTVIDFFDYLDFVAAFASGC